MESKSSTGSPMIQPVSTPEAQPLLGSPLPELSYRKRLGHACAFPRHLCPPSKAAALILVWSAIVGSTYTFAMDSSVALGVAGKTLKIHGHKHHLNIFINILIPYTCLALVLLIYPLSGFMADVCCGRYKTVIGSLCVLVCSMGFFTVGSALAMTSIDHTKEIFEHWHEVEKYLLALIGIIAFVLFVIGLSGFQANFIQLGLDQLHEAPSEYLGLFVHWAIWIGSITTPVLHLIFAAYACTAQSSNSLLYVIFFITSVVFCGALLIACIQLSEEPLVLFRTRSTQPIQNCL